MPALPNQRQEHFCQLLKRGMTPYEAFEKAGYPKHRGNCYRLRDDKRIKRRLAELTRHIAVKTRVTVESLTEEFNEAIELAKETKNAPAITQAAIAKGKLHGLMIDRKESGGPGDFAAAQSVDEVLDVMRKEFGDEAANALMAALGKREASEQAEQPPAHDLDASRSADDRLN